MNTFRLALIQLKTGANKQLNVKRAQEFVRQAAANGSSLVALPECFNCPYGNQYFPDYAEPIPDGETARSLSDTARELGIHLIGGSIPERDADGKLYNTCTVWSPDGALLVKHRKIHLFDIDIPGKIRFQESETLSPGKHFSTFDTPHCRIGIGICYDVRFAELAMVYADLDCRLLVYPGAFSAATGPVSWELLGRARAADNQLYVAMPAPATDTEASYESYGHSMVAGPDGAVVAGCQGDETVVYADIDLGEVDRYRESVPVRKQKRFELYSQVKPISRY